MCLGGICSTAVIDNLYQKFTENMDTIRFSFPEPLMTRTSESRLQLERFVHEEAIVVRELQTQRDFLISVGSIRVNYLKSRLCQNFFIYPIVTDKLNKERLQVEVVKTLKYVEYRGTVICSDNFGLLQFVDRMPFSYSLTEIFSKENKPVVREVKDGLTSRPLYDPAIISQIFCGLTEYLQVM